MGNSNKHKCGQIFIQTEKPFYFSGEQVNGTVYLNLWENFQGNALYLKIKGIEQCQWQEQENSSHTTTNPDGSSNTQTVTHYHHYRGKNIFYQHRIVLYQWGYNYMPPGQYSFPFQFLLSAHLPGSFYEHHGDYNASIIYKVKAECEPFSKNFGKIKHAQDLVVREPIKQLQQNFIAERIQKATTWCCISQGESKIRAYFEKNSYLPGETAQIIAEIDNTQCNLAVKRIECDLVNQLRLVSDSGREKTFTRKMARATFPGVAKNESAIGDNRRITPLTLTSNSQNQTIQPSTNGNKVQSRYYLEVKSNLEGCTCCSSDPNVEVPIQIVSPPPLNYGQVQAPQDWHPKVFDTKAISFNPQDIYTNNRGDVNIQIGQNYDSSQNLNIGMNQGPNMNFQANLNMNQNNDYQYPQQN